MRLDEETRFIVRTIALIWLGIGALWIGASFMEARTYSRLTGHTVTTWDAMWVSLRVQDAPRRAE